MKKLFLGLAVFFLLVSTMSNAEQFRSGNIGNLMPPFKKIESISEGRAVSLQFADQGTRWLIGINTNRVADRRLSKYGEVLELKIGDKLELVERHARILIEVDRNGLITTFDRDQRSIGGKMETETFLIAVPSSMSQEKKLER